MLFSPFHVIPGQVLWDLMPAWCTYLPYFCSIMNVLLPSGVMFSDTSVRLLRNNTRSVSISCISSILPPFMKDRCKYWHLSVISSQSSAQFCSWNKNFKYNEHDIQILWGTSWRYSDTSLKLPLNVASNPSQCHFQGKFETEDLNDWFNDWVSPFEPFQFYIHTKCLAPVSTARKTFMNQPPSNQIHHVCTFCDTLPLLQLMIALVVTTLCLLF